MITLSVPVQAGVTIEVRPSALDEAGPGGVDLRVAGSLEPLTLPMTRAEALALLSLLVGELVDAAARGRARGEGGR